MEHLPRHHNIVKLLGTYEDCHKVYLIMELCEGGELCDRMRNICIYTEKDAATILKDIIQAVKVRELLHMPNLSLSSFSCQLLFFFFLINENVGTIAAYNVF
jgi:serine/threonine protein kinase